MRRLSIILLLALAAATPAAAQEWLVNRERFRYIGNRLTIDVATEAAGRLQIIRGQPGIVRVAGRAPVGFATAGLTDSDLLTLSAAGTGPVDFMVVVPERVWITVRIPTHGPESVGAFTRARTFEWGNAASAPTAWGDPAPAAPAVRTLPPQPSEAMGPELYTTYAADLAPPTINVPDLSAVRTVTVRTGGARFRIGTSRPLALQAGNPQSIEIRPSGAAMDIVIEVPAGTRNFALGLHGAEALTIREGVITATCTPATRQWLSAGREWVTFNPVDGRLDCRSDAPRHKG